MRPVASGLPPVSTPRARRFRPRVVILPYPQGRHPDHRIASQLAYDACFLAGLSRFDAPGEPHRPLNLLYRITSRDDAEIHTYE